MRAIRRLADRAARDRAGRFYVEGVRFVSEAVTARAIVDTLVVCPPLLRSQHGQRVAQRLIAAAVPRLEVTPALFAEISLVAEPQGIGAVVRQRWTPLGNLTAAGAPLWVAVETVNSPGNLGTLLRTCEAAGGAGLIVLGPEADPFHAAVVRATMGAHFALRFVRTDCGQFAAWHRRSGFAVVGASPGGTLDYREADLRRPTVLLMGCERHGLTPEQEALCDSLVRIPMVGRSDSLNLGVAGSILLYEAYAQRHPVARDADLEPTGGRQSVCSMLSR